MYLDRISEQDPGTPLIVRDSLARQQWEAAIAASHASDQASAWPSRRVLTRSNWLRWCWESAAAAGALERNRFVLSPQQADRLWRRVVEESDIGKTLVGSKGVVHWARSARQRLLEAGLDPGRQGGAAWDHDAGVFLDWNRGFERHLNRNDWIDPDALLFRVNRLPVAGLAHDVVLLDPAPASVEARRLVTRWEAAGCKIVQLEPTGGPAVHQQLLVEDPFDELARAAEWVARNLDEHPDRRYAIVVPELEARQDELRSFFGDRLGSERLSSTSSMPLAGIGICGAALNAISLLAPGADFDVLSRWLRSPFFVGEDVDRERAAAALEIDLRGEPRAQQDLAAAWRRHGLRELVAKRLPHAARQLDKAWSQLPRRATPTTWTAIWQSCLKALSWQGLESGLPDVVQHAWDNVWARFSELTPVTGAISQELALSDLLAIASAEGVYEPAPLSGLLLASQIDQIGPGFAGAWITGFTDAAPYAAASANPLLPWSVQAAHRLPGAAPEVDLQATIDALKALIARVPEAIFSCPRHVGDQPQTPSPLLDGWRSVAAEDARAESPAGFAASRIGARQWRVEADTAPALGSSVIPGGTRTLDLQAVCPVKAFIESRLGARRLEAPVRGLDARLRGILVHRVLELLLDPRDSSPPDSRVDRSISRAFTEIVGAGSRSWQTQVDAERARLEAVVAQLLESETRRAPFETIAVEQRTEIEVAGATIRCRIDRIDRMTDGPKLVIDYKTGRAQSNRWFESRLSECQLPLYAQQFGDAGIAIVRLDGSGVEYSGAGPSATSLPSGFRKFEATEWQSQVAGWREQIATLVEEFVSGDVRIRSDAHEFVASDAREHAGGAFAPLSRVGDLA